MPVVGRERRKEVREGERKRALWCLFLKGHESSGITAPLLWSHLNWIISIKALSSNVTTVDSGASTYGFGEHNSGHSIPGPSPGSSLLLETRDKRQHGPPGHDSLPQLNSSCPHPTTLWQLTFQYGCESAWRVFLWKPGNAGQAGEFCSFFLLLQAQLGKVENGWSIHATLSTLLAGRDCSLSWGKASVDHTLVFPHPVPSAL